MRAVTATVLAAALVAWPVLVAGPAAAGGRRCGGGVSPIAMLLARHTLASGDGWGSAGPGTTGGAGATSDQVYVVSTRAELLAALEGDQPKIVLVKGTIDGFEGPDGNLLSCEDLADPEYDFDSYLATYDPEVWGRDEEPSGPLEEARERSMRNQEDQTVINPGSNTTLFGLDGATLRHLTLLF